MAHILNYSSLTVHNGAVKTQFGGSAKYQIIDGKLSEKRTDKEVSDSKKKFDSKKMYGVNKKNEKIDLDAIEKKIELRTVTLNKSKVRKKCHALSRLKKSMKFLAFYTISFPEGLTDHECYKFFNIWLTRCRRSSNLTTYLWVAERQKNGTIHFHLLTNDFMPIQVVNGYMAKTLSNQKKRGNETLGSVNTENYNGIDVKKVGKKRKTLIGYLTKYITKNSIEFFKQPWHCSRNVSRLFTSQHFKDEDSGQLLKQLPKEDDKYIHYDTSYCKVAAFKFIPDENVFGELDRINESIYKNGG